MSRPQPPRLASHLVDAGRILKRELVLMAGRGKEVNSALTRWASSACPYQTGRAFSSVCISNGRHRCPGVAISSRFSHTEAKPRAGFGVSGLAAGGVGG